MKTLTRLFATLSLFLGASVAMAAGSETNVGITHLEAYASSGYVYVLFAANPTGGPGCATGNGFVINGSTSAGAQAVAIATLAYISGKTVLAVGTGACTLNATWEDLSYIYTE